MRRILALAAFASLVPFAAVADEISGEDIVVEPEPIHRERAPVKESVVMEEKPVSLPPPGWKPPKSDEKGR